MADKIKPYKISIPMQGNKDTKNIKYKITDLAIEKLKNIASAEGHSIRQQVAFALNTYIDGCGK